MLPVLMRPQQAETLIHCAMNDNIKRMDEYSISFRDYTDMLKREGYTCVGWTNAGGIDPKHYKGSQLMWESKRRNLTIEVNHEHRSYYITDSSD